MPSTRTSNTALDTAIRTRANTLLLNHTQAEIARKTGTTRANVNQYMKNTRIPAWFCTALANGLNVNPTWLLTGEGKTYLTDVSDQADQMTGNLLEVVNAMKSITRMKLGALAGKDSLESLKNLDEALRSHNQLSVKLEAQVNTLLEELIGNVSLAFKQDDWESVRHNLRAGRQAAQFSRDADLLLELDQFDARYEISQGDWERGVALQRSVLMRTIGQSHKVDGAFCSMVHNYALVLLFSFRIKTARQVLLAALGLIKDSKDQEVNRKRHKLNVLLANCELNLGRTKSSLRRLTHHFPLMDEQSRSDLEFLMVRTQVLTGIMSLEALVERKPASYTLKIEAIALSSLLTNDPEFVRKTMNATYSQKPVKSHGIHKGLYIFAECLAACEHQKVGKLVEKLRSYYATLENDQQHRSFGPIVQIICEVETTSLLLAARSESEATQPLMEAQSLLEGLAEDCSPPLIILASHYRNAVLLGRLNPKLRRISPIVDQAQRFFKRMHKRGLVGLTRMLKVNIDGISMSLLAE